MIEEQNLDRSNYSPEFNPQFNLQHSPSKPVPQNRNLQHFDSAYQQLLMKITSENHENTDNEQEALVYRLLLGQNDQEKLAKNELFSKKYQNEACERLSGYASLIKTKREKKAEEIINNELKECTFNPGILVAAGSEGHRSLTQFLSSQNHFLEQREHKLKEIKEKLQVSDEKQKPLKPQLCPESLEILKKKKNPLNPQPAYERLYALNKKIKNLNKPESEENSPDKNENFFTNEKKNENTKSVATFTPSLNPKSKQMLKNALREGKIEERLYQEHFKKLKKIEKKQQEPHPEIAKKKILPSEHSQKISEKLIAESFLKEYQNSAREFLVKGRDDKLDYLSMCEIMKSLGFITNSSQLSGGLFERERTLIFEQWWGLKGQAFQGVSSRNLCLFLLGILGLAYRLIKNEDPQGFTAKALPKDEQFRNYDDERVNVKLASSLKGEMMRESGVENEEAGAQISVRSLALGNIVENSNEFYEQWAKLKQGKIYGKFDNGGDLELNRRDISEIHRHFQLFYRNRLSNESLKKTENIESHSFEPKILESSKNMAGIHREKVLEKTQEYLRNQALEKKLPENGNFSHADMLILSREANKFEKSKMSSTGGMHEDEMKECTFHPKTLGQKTGEKIDRNLELYSLSKTKKKPVQKDINDREYEKHCNECTFQPDLKKSDKEITFKKVYAKNIDKFINRMRSAQKEKEYMNLWTKTEERGYPGKRDAEAEFQSSQYGKDFEEKLSIFKESSYQSPGVVSQKYEENSEGMPLLFVEVNIGPGRTERIIVNEGDRSEDLANKFAEEFNLDDNMRKKLKELLDSQIAGLLHRIEEEMPSVNSEDSYKR